MNTYEFNKYGEFFYNLMSEQRKGLFDSEEVEKLENTTINQKALFLLSQVLVGNVSEPMETIKSMQKANRRRIFNVWLNIIKDPDELKAIGKMIVEDYI